MLPRGLVCCGGSLDLNLIRQRVLDPEKWEVEIAPVEVLAGELLSRIEETEPALVCIASLPPGGLAHTRYLCKRLRARFPEIKIVVGRWGFRGDLEPSQARDAFHSISPGSSG